MRTTLVVLLTALLALWAWFAFAVAPAPPPPPARLPDDGLALSAASLNNRGVALARAGRDADALAFFERARDFRPLDERVAGNLAATRARLERRAWLRALVPATAAAALLGVAALARRAVRAARDAARLRTLRLRGAPLLALDARGDRAELSLDFNEPVEGLLERHPLTIVWSSAAHGKHMKSRPPARAEGASVRVALEGERLRRLRRYPGTWRGFLYLGRTPVGEAAARVA